MQAIEKATKKSFILAFILTIMLICGIPMIPVGFAVVGGALGIVIAVIGIVFTVLGFYGCPIAWVNYTGKLSLKRIIIAVEQENLYVYSDIAAQLGISVKDLMLKIDTCFKKQYLTGYIRGETRLNLNESRDLRTAERTVQCAHCGAKFTYNAMQDPVCPYCGCISDVER